MLTENKDDLLHIFRCIQLTPQQKRRFERYIDMLEAWSLRTNLVSSKDKTKIARRHIAESLEIARLDLISNKTRLLDLGSGAGFPGVPLSIFYPTVHTTLLDSKRMRTLFLQEVVDELTLHNVSVLCSRAEDVDSLFNFDYVTARAVARLPLLWDFCQPLLKNDGLLIALKGGEVEGEVAELTIKYDVKSRVIPVENPIFPDSVDKKIVIASR